MSKETKLKESQEKDVTGGAILSRGHKCKKCGKEFDVVLPNNWMTEDDMPGYIPNWDELQRRAKEQEISKSYCYECRKKLNI